MLFWENRYTKVRLFILFASAECIKYFILYAHYSSFQISRGANIERRSELGYTPIHVTAHYDRVGVARLLLESGVNPDEEDFQVRGCSQFMFTVFPNIFDQLVIIKDGKVNKTYYIANVES